MYNHQEIDSKWQKKWEEEKVYRALNPEETEKEPFYCLVEFPFPSGAGLHVGHPRSYTAIDVIARKKRAEGKNVLYPMGWDAFGLPTEQYAIKTGKSPAEVTKENVDNFRKQLKSLGLSFDWEREVNTTDPEYYKWTQWMFLEFYKAGLAYVDEREVWWCEELGTVLANEEVINGKSERGDFPCVRKPMRQWMIRITDYAEKLLDGLNEVDFLPQVEKQQRDWIGRSEGAEIEFSVENSAEKIRVFTTRPDTLFGVTYLVLAPEHRLVQSLVSDEQKSEVDNYLVEVLNKDEQERLGNEKEKTGVFLGTYAVNPVNGEKVPIWIGDYVLVNAGTGAVMAVPAHDERDFEFAKKFDLPVKQVIESEEECFTESGVLVNSGEFSGMKSEEAKLKIVEKLEKEEVGEKKISYRLRDWVFSRQRYWGEPFPIVWVKGLENFDLAKKGEIFGELPEKPIVFEENGESWIAMPVREKDLPLKLPEVEDYAPAGDGKSALAKAENWVNVYYNLESGEVMEAKGDLPEGWVEGKREIDTMPNWAGSCWYFLRYLDPKNEKEFVSKEKLDYWMPVDWYNGGMEHTTLHLLYSRFWHRFLFDRGWLPVAEPYAKRTSHGLILAEGGEKMSKSKGNVVNPDEIVQEFGADTLRVYELFIGPFSEAVPWSNNGVIGVRRFLDRVLKMDEFLSNDENQEVLRARHKMVKEVLMEIDEMKFNVAVAELMKFVNVVYKEKKISKESLLEFAKVLDFFAPHVANELAEKVGFGELLEKQNLPEFDENLVIDEEIEIAIQVNGKLRGSIKVSIDLPREEILEKAKNEPNVAKFIEGEIKKEIFVPGKLVNFVV